MPQLRADAVAHRRASAVAADQVAAGQRDPRAVVETLGVRGDAVRTFGEGFEARAVEDADARLRGGVREQQRLEKQLVDAVGELGRRPPPVVARLAAHAAGARRQPDARELRSGRRDAARHVVAIFGRQPGLTDPVGEAEPPEDLHRAGRDLVALDVGRLAGAPGLEHRHVDAAPGEVERQREADRPRADDDDAGVEMAIHGACPGVSLREDRQASK
jgi:hypothetical protein